MSNYTDGKKALAVGEFDAAEKKLIKALDKRPDDGELWWALTLCKTKCRSDAELKARLTEETNRAAADGERPPEFPFDETYCKNALAFDRTGRRRVFVDELYGELSELWAEKCGKPFKKRKAVSAYKPKSKSSALRAAAYASVAPSAAGAFLLVYAVFASARWALWTGLILFVAAVAAFLWIRYVLKRAGKAAGAAFALMIAVFAVFALALLVVGMFTGTRYAVIIGAAVLITLAVFGMFKLMFNKNGKKPTTDRSPRAARSVKTKKPKADDGYKDEFD